MRALCAGLVAAAVLNSGLARATEAAGKDKGSSISTGGSHMGPSPSTGGEQGGNASGDAGVVGRRDPGAAETKPWEVGLNFEYHHLVRQNDLEGYAVNKNLNYFYFYGQYDLTKHDRLSLRYGFYERFIADMGETGLRSSDVSLAYTRAFDLPGDVSLRAQGALSAPTSFASEKMSLITAPTVSVTGERSFGRFTVDLRLYGKTYIVRYAEAEGGNPNPSWEFGGFLSAEYRMPFIEALTLGAEVHTGYATFYMPKSVNDQNAKYGAVQDATFPSQPWEQEYGGEIFARYTLPTLFKVKSDVTVSFAQGDPTMGYTSIIHDGFTHIYPFWRLSTEVYAVLNLHY